MKYIFLRDGKPEEVKPERWVWGVVYKDDSELHQFGNDKIFHQIKEIKWEEVKMFSMYRFDDMKKRIDLLVLPDMQVFHFYRNVRPATLDHFIKVYVFGFKHKGADVYNTIQKDGKLIDESKKEGDLIEQRASYFFILPDDRVLVSNKDNVDLTRFELTRKK